MKNVRSVNVRSGLSLPVGEGSSGLKNVRSANCSHYVKCSHYENVRSVRLFAVENVRSAKTFAVQNVRTMKLFAV